MAAIPDTEAETKNMGITSDVQEHTESDRPGPYTLQRSSSPNYDGKVDKSQHITAAGIAFLQKQKIGHVICLNSDVMSSHAIGHEFANANPKIAFTHIPVEDYHSPTLGEMERGYQAYVAAKKDTLVWCGYGFGRTGMMITALQYKIQKAKGKTVKLTHADYSSNHVEQYHQGLSTGQYETLDALQK
ncbi:hypothetical protein NHQ30_006793 [Ciborinia camelliae]|nr:hypothetical protein NHQ30_006793 [Ciborinia camelliae]